MSRRQRTRGGSYKLRALKNQARGIRRALAGLETAICGARAEADRLQREIIAAESREATN